MRKSLLAVAALCAAPLFAGETGWFVGAAAGFEKVGNNDQIVAVPLDANGNTNGALLKLDYGSSVSPVIWAGYKTGMGTFRMTYWGYSEKASLTAQNALGFQTAFGDENQLGDSYANRVDAASELKSHTIDLSFSREMVKTERSNWNWSVGLRHWKTEQTSDMVNDWVPASGAFDDRVIQGSDAKGVGFTAGITGNYHFTEKFHASTSIGFAYLVGSTDSAYWESDMTEWYTVSADTDHAYRQTSLGAKLAWDVWSGLSLAVGYHFKHMDNAVDTIDFGGYGGNLMRVQSTGVSFNGFTLGANWKF